MANSKHFGLSGISENVELGKGGLRVRDDSSGVEARNNADDAYAVIRAASPVGDNDVVTKKYLETQAGVFVTGQIDGGTPPSPADGVVYVVTTTGGAYTINELWRRESAAWVQITVPEGLTISVTDALAGGTVEFTTDHRYLWDADGTAWIDIGPAIGATKIVKSQRADLSFDTSSPVNIGDAVPIGARIQKVIVNVTQVFDGTSESTITVGDAGDPDRFATSAEVDLHTLGTYICDTYYNYGSATQIIGTYVQDSASQGTATIEVVYSIS